MTPYRFEPEDQIELNRMVGEALPELEEYTPPLIQTRNGAFDLMGTPVYVGVGAMISMNHVTDARQKIKIMTNDWTWEGSVRVTVDGGRPRNKWGSSRYSRRYHLEDTGYFDGDMDRFMRDLIVVRMMRE